MKTVEHKFTLKEEFKEMMKNEIKEELKIEIKKELQEEQALRREKWIVGMFHVLIVFVFGYAFGLGIEMGIFNL